MKTTRFRSRTVEVEAVRLTDDADWDAIGQWCGASPRQLHEPGDLKDQLAVPTPGGDVAWANIGDWIVRTVAHIFRVYRPDEFMAEFERAPRTEPAPNVVHIVAVETDDGPMDCEDDDPVHVWVTVATWSPRRAVLVQGSQFAAAAGCAPGALQGRHFYADLPLDEPAAESGERIEFGDLRECPPIEQVERELFGAGVNVDGVPAGIHHVDADWKTDPGRTYTAPEVFTTGVEEGWADPETDPTRIDWAARALSATISFDVVDGRPVNPCTRFGYPMPEVRYGRNQLGHWGEQLAADALVFAHQGMRRWLLMVRRDDRLGWAAPGGYVEPGEGAVQAAARELEEETSLSIAAAASTRSQWGVDGPRYVPDPRASGEAWMVTVPCRIYLGDFTDLPAVHGGDDAAHAAWIHADSYAELLGYLDEKFDGDVFPAHVDMLKEVLG
jgi:ADP-ribose pyrophosphatase